MKALLGILLLANVALLLWNMGQREFLYDKNAPAADFHPELVELLPPERLPTMAKVTIDEAGDVISENTRSQAAPSQQMQGPSAGITQGEESIGSAASIITTPDSEAEAAMAVEISAGQCMFIGPYTTAIDRDRAGRQLRDMKISFTENENLKGRLLGYRIYQGPFSTNADVARAIRRLEQQGIKDLYLMNEAQNVRFISLGFFSNEKSATEFMKNFSVLRVATKQRQEYETHFWINVSDIEAIEKLRERNAMPMPKGISKIIKACSDVP